MQLSLDFSGKMALNGKKLEPITARVPSDFRTIFQIISSKLNLNESELARKYLIAGLKQDLGEIFMLESNLQKSLGEIIANIK